MATNLTGFIGGYTEMGTWLQDQAKGELDMQKLGQDVRETEDSYQAHRKMIKLAQEKNAATETQTGGVPRNILDPLKNMQEAAVEAGLPQEAFDYGTKLTTIQKDMAETEAKSADIGMKALQGMQSNLDAVLKSADPEQAWLDYQKDYYATHPGITRAENAQLYQGVRQAFARPFSREMLENMKREGMTTFDQLKNKHEEASIRHEQASTAEAYTRVGLIKAQVETEHLQARALRKELGDEGMGEDAPVPDKDLAPIATHLKAITGKDALTDEEAKDLAVPIYRETKRLQKSGKTYDEAVGIATRNRMADINATVTAGQKSESGQTVDELIDELIPLASRRVGATTPMGRFSLPVTGGLGIGARAIETGLNIAGWSDETVAHQYQSKTAMLQVLLNRQMQKGRGNKYEWEALQKVVKGLKVGDTPQNVKAALEDLRSVRNRPGSSQKNAIPVQSIEEAQKYKGQWIKVPPDAAHPQGAYVLVGG